MPRWIRNFLLALIPSAAIVVCAATDHVLSRVDRARAEAAAARAEVRLLRAQAEQQRMHTHDAVDFTAELVITNKRLEVLRATMAKLISAGVHWPQFVALPELADVHWPAWPERGWDLKCEPMRDQGEGALARGER